jgi:hypothetical protein
MTEQDNAFEAAVTLIASTTDTAVREVQLTAFRFKMISSVAQSKHSCKCRLDVTELLSWSRFGEANNDTRERSGTSAG